jgi:triosephosphate isomerase
MTPGKRTTLVVANWKMNLNGTSASALARAVAADPACEAGVGVLLAPPFPYLERVAACLGSSSVGLAGQDLHWEAAGAFTGAVSAPMLVDAGASHVLAGHSERRHLFGDDDAAVRRKIEAACASGLEPIVCVGENESQRDTGQAIPTVQGQVESALQASGWPGRPTLLLAYEPVWAIGTGRVAEPGQAAEMHAAIRDLAGPSSLVLYGGSVNPGNAAALLKEEELDGLLVGGASLQPESFLAIVGAAGSRGPG